MADDDIVEPGPSTSKQHKYNRYNRRQSENWRQQRNRRDQELVQPININPQRHSKSLNREPNQFRRHHQIVNNQHNKGNLTKHNHGREVALHTNYPVRKQEHRPRFIGFKTLQDLANSDESDIITNLHTKKDGFFQLIGSPIEKNDVFVLVLQIISKVCSSSFDELKLKLLLDICNSQFIPNLLKFLMDLPYVENKQTNSLYWNDQLDFWKNFIMFCECIINASPSTALKKCRSLIEAMSKSCLEGLNERHGFTLLEEYAIKITELREKLTAFEMSYRVLNTVTQKDKLNLNLNVKPPDDFRQLSLQPNPIDFFDHKPFLRPNIVDGGYQDVEHYLDVQFRLMREDCFGPIRVGVLQYREDPNRYRYDNIRVHRNVRFIEPYISNTNFGSLVQIDINNRRNQKFKRVNWAYNKRFIFGSLVLFSEDNFKSFIVATILDRDVNNLSEGKIPVSLISEVFNEDIYNFDKTYTMIESEVYYEPYYHVMKALQDPTFPENIAMQQYIVTVNPDVKPPAYLTPDAKFIFSNKRVLSPEQQLEEGNDDMIDDLTLSGLPSLSHDNKSQITFRVLQKETWPSKEQLGFDESQYEAFCLALTNEFAVIQGPPGTGKTYLGVHIANTLLHSLHKNNGCLMLVICYTNHALDQFLEAILSTTTSVVRIGGQSKNEAMTNINLNKLRRDCKGHVSDRVFMENRFIVKDALRDFRRALVQFDVLNNGIISSQCLKHEIPEVRLLCEFYKSVQDPLNYWLFQTKDLYSTSIENILLEYEEPNVDTSEEIRQRTEFILDDDDDETKDLIEEQDLKASFSLNNSIAKLKLLLKNYKQEQNPQKQSYLENQIRNLDSEIKLYNLDSDYCTLYKALFRIKDDHRQIEIVVNYLHIVIFHLLQTTFRHHKVKDNLKIQGDMAMYITRPINLVITPYTNFNRIQPANRWALYFLWVKDKIDQVRSDIGNLQGSIKDKITAYEESRMLTDLNIIKSKKVVGMTTSGAARLRKLLQTLKPPIVIVEEAAEVLEQHIVTSLTKHCRHLILIGDHQQLRPSASHMVLARHYNMEVSLFERMIKNGVHSRRLAVQHRMRPEIAALISPHIYPDLANHPSVHTFPDVLGMKTNLFFFSHDYKEDDIDENSSRSNIKEADLTMALGNYLVQQGYSGNEVTILAAYSGQAYYMRKQRQNYSHLFDVKITVVDNYQGEESKIILLSLVRNNAENKIGFLGTENRICVALSRAKEGFYIFGNMPILKENSQLWRNIATTLEDNESLGNSLSLKCQNHPDNITIISSLEDFEKVPEGGCLLQCNYKMHCNHKCLRYCHGYDREHTTDMTKCTAPCESIICDLGHVCPLKCFEACRPCKVIIRKLLPCGHEKDLHCHVNPEDNGVLCLVESTVTLPDCGHEAVKKCYEKIRNIVCLTKCEYRVEKCGHVCLRKCHVNNDPKHEKYECRKACSRAKNGCTADLIGNRANHQCLKQCYETCDDCNVIVSKKRSNCKHSMQIACSEDPNKTQCKSKCSRIMDCGHFCKRKCFEPCEGCTQMVTKILPGCKHKIKIMCSVEATPADCTENCNKTLSCGHRCRDMCNKKCDPSKCTELSTHKIKSPCGHNVPLPCNISMAVIKGSVTVDVGLKYCNEPCTQDLACKHRCSGTCARCFQGRIHVPCTQPCRRTNICGHECVEPCNQMCPPCNRPCEVKCQHSRCDQPCGVPCVMCQEKCSRACRHGACERRCGEPCSREPCEEPCDLKLACGHRCRGLCGDPCPDICKQCRPDTFPTGFIGEEFEENDKFILLQDCGHVLGVEDMDNLMRTDKETIAIRVCPLCRKPIINTNRYKDMVLETFKDEINPIKERVFGNKQLINAKKLELNDKVRAFLKTYDSIIDLNSLYRQTFYTLINFVKGKSKFSLLQVEMFLVYFNIMDMIAECYKMYEDEEITTLKDEVNTQIEIICKVLSMYKQSFSTFKLSQQQQKDIGNEIKRLNSIIQLAKIFNNASYKSTAKQDNVKAASEETRSIVFNILEFNETTAIEALKRLEKAVAISGFVTKSERDLIVKAIGLSTGHWFKCPNGHFYAIGECGGAMATSRCIECGEAIGGSNHRLLSSNALAREMDGAQYPAWSERNNLANFII